MTPTPLTTTTATVTTDLATDTADSTVTTMTPTPPMTTTEILVKKEHYDLAWCEFSFHTLDQVLECDYINTVIKDNSFMIDFGKMMQPYDNVDDIDPLKEDQYMYMVNGMTTHIEGCPTDKVLQHTFQKALEIRINKDVRLWDVAMRNLGSYIIEEEVMELEHKKIELPHTFTIDSVHRVRVAEHIMCKFRKKNSPVMG